MPDQHHDVVHRERRRPHEYVEPSNRLPARQMPSQVVGGAGRCGDRDAGRGGDLVIVDPLVTGNDSGWRPGVVPDHLHGDGVLDPLCSVQCRRGHPGHYALAARPQPGTVDAVQQGGLVAVRQVNVAVNPAVPLPQIMVGHRAGRQSLTAHNELSHACMLTADTDKPASL